MTAPKAATQGNGGNHRFSGLSVYEIANAAAKEVRRINRRFYAEKRLPPANLVRSTMKKVIDGHAGHQPDEDHPENETGAKDETGAEEE